MEYERKVAPQESPQANTQAAPQESPQENTQESPQENTQESPQANTQAAPQESPQANTQAASQESPQANTQAAPQESPQAATQAAQQEATQATPQANTQANTQANRPNYTDPIIQCQNLTKAFKDVVALNGINLNIGRGKVIGLLGPNGSGKTTLIKILNGLLTPTVGKVFIDGRPVGTYTKSIVSYLPDRMYFADWMKVRDVLDLFRDFYEDFDREKAISMCRALGIQENERIKTLSKGTKEKIQLILVMSRNAQLYLLDEPIAGVDPATREYILKTIINNYGDNATVIISTHLISDIERILDEVIFIRYGNIVRHQTVDEIKEKEGKSVDELFREEFRMEVYSC